MQFEILRNREVCKYFGFVSIVMHELKELLSCTANSLVLQHILLSNIIVFCVIHEGTGNTIIGELNENLLVKYFATNGNVTAVQKFFIKSGGIYLFPEAVPSDGRLLSVRAYGYLGSYDDPSMELKLGPSLPEVSEPNGEIFLFVVLYRPSEDGNTYSLAHEPAELKHGFTPGTIPRNQSGSLDWEVQEGDLIGVFIPEVCVYSSNETYSCASQVNLRTDECRSALYHPALEDINNLPREEFEEVSVWLNVEAVLSEGSK